MREYVLGISLVFEAVGATFVVLGFVLAGIRAGSRALRRDYSDAYSSFRETFGRSILLGLEVLVAADLVRTIAVEPTLENLAVLASLIAIRTLLSWSLEVEIDGRWPWQKREDPSTTPR